VVLLCEGSLGSYLPNHAPSWNAQPTTLHEALAVTKKIRRMDLGKMHDGGESAEPPHLATPRGVRFRLLDWEESNYRFWPEL
jgi:hypothetical protein